MFGRTITLPVLIFIGLSLGVFSAEARGGIVVRGEVLGDQGLASGKAATTTPPHVPNWLDWDLPGGMSGESGLTASFIGCGGFLCLAVTLLVSPPVVSAAVVGERKLIYRRPIFPGLFRPPR